jgi:hypothetical protein
MMVSIQDLNEEDCKEEEGYEKIGGKPERIP